MSSGRPYLAIPGPSVMPDQVLQAMHRPSPNIYAGELLEIAQSLVPDLKTIARTQGHVAMYISNGHGLWEAALSNLLSRGDKVLVCINGAFGAGWADVAQALGAQVERLEFATDAAVDPAQLEAVLRADTAHEIKAVLTVHVDTATSLRNDIKAMRDAIDAANHPALFAVDAIASLGCERFEMDAWGVDVVLSASQKGLMTPAGMGFIWFNDAAKEHGKSADMRTPYWDWTNRAAPEALYYFFNGTAPTQHLYGLRKAVDLMLAEGMDPIWARHACFAQAYWAAIEVWGADGEMRLNVADPAARSHAVTAVRMTAPNATRLRDWLETQAGITLGIPIGFNDPSNPAWHGDFRIGHMGHLNAQMVLGVCGSIEAALDALDIPHGTGGARAAGKCIAAAAPASGSACSEAQCCV